MITAINQRGVVGQDRQEPHVQGRQIPDAPVAMAGRTARRLTGAEKGSRTGDQLFPGDKVLQGNGPVSDSVGWTLSQWLPGQNGLHPLPEPVHFLRPDR